VLPLALAASIAQTVSAQPSPPRLPGGIAPAVSRVPPPFVLMGGEGAFERETVRGAPYSARTQTELFQTLADGNRIAGSWTGFVARDGQGRVRREQPLAAIGAVLAEPDAPPLIVILDPVQRLTLFVDNETRTVRRMPWEETEGDGRTAEDAPPPGGPEGPRPSRRRAGLLSPGAIVAKPSIEPLGAREIAGVAAQGTRATYVIPAGRIGNERPLSIVSERWTSPELGTVLETRYSDPRTGETRFRLTEIERREPDRALFEVPAGFTVEDGPPRHRRGSQPRLP
jgi:hypothetical protein